MVSAVAVAGDFQTRNLVTPFQTDFTIVAMLQVGSSFGLQLNEGSPQTYEGHNIWDIDALGVVLALAAADDTIGVAASGPDAIGLAEASLDAFDGRSARLLDAPGLASLVGDVPSGFAAAVLSQCENLPLFTDVQALPGCTGAVVAADILAQNLVVLHAIFAFEDQDQAQNALERTTELLESQSQTLEFDDLGVIQEGNKVWVRVIGGGEETTAWFRFFDPDP